MYISYVVIVTLTTLIIDRICVRGETFKSNNDSELSMLRKILFSSYHNFSQYLDKHDFLKGKTRINSANYSIIVSSPNNSNSSQNSGISGHHMKNVHNNVNQSKFPSTVAVQYPSAAVAIIKKSHEYLYYLPTPEGFMNTIIIIIIIIIISVISVIK